MEDMSWGAIASIGLVAIIALSVIYNFIKERGAGKGSAGAPSSLRPEMSTAPLSEEDIARQEYRAILERLSPEQREALLVHAAIFVWLAWVNMPDETAVTGAIAQAVLHSPVDPDLVRAGELYWDAEYDSGWWVQVFMDNLASGKHPVPDARKRALLEGVLTAIALIGMSGNARVTSLREDGDFKFEYLPALDRLVTAYLGNTDVSQRAEMDAAAQEVARRIHAERGME
jgi:hypothetical protein